jgi:hypothetical protein
MGFEGFEGLRIDLDGLSCDLEGLRSDLDASSCDLDGLSCFEGLRRC